MAPFWWIWSAIDRLICYRIAVLQPWLYGYISIQKSKLSAATGPLNMHTALAQGRRLHYKSPTVGICYRTCVRCWSG
jgi:hypothetical protein